MSVIMVWLAVTAQAGVATGVDVAPRRVPCAAAALHVSANLLNTKNALDSLARRLGVRQNGVCSLAEIQSLATELGFVTQPVAANQRAVGIVRQPLIVALRQENSTLESAHFVVLYGAKGDKVQLIDYPHRPRFISLKELSKQWDGRGLYLARRPDELPGPADRESKVEVFVYLVAWGLLAVSTAAIAYSRFARPTKS